MWVAMAAARPRCSAQKYQENSRALKSRLGNNEEEKEAREGEAETKSEEGGGKPLEEGLKAAAAAARAEKSCMELYGKQDLAKNRPEQ